MSNRNLKNISSLLQNIENIDMRRFYSTTEFRNRIQNLGQTTGKGGMASEVKVIPNSPYVVKLSRPCLASRDDLKLQCKHLKDDDAIRKIPYGDKMLIELPNFLSESIIGGYMGRLVNARYTLHYMHVLGSWIDVSEETSYLVLPQLKTDLREIIRSVEDIYLLLFQTSQGLTAGQEMDKFTHNDLHAGNILYEEVPVNIRGIKYPIVIHSDTDDSPRIANVYVKNRGYISKIADYGLARMETESFVINGLIDTYPIRHHAVFDRSVDIVSIVSSLFIMPTMKDYDSHIRYVLGNSYDKVRDDILQIVFGPLTFNQILTKYFPNHPKYWRPASAKRKIVYFDINDMHTITRRLAERLVDYNVAEVYDNTRHYQAYELLPLPQYSLLYPWRVESPELRDLDPVIRLSPTSIVEGFDATPIAPGILLESLKIKYNSTIKEWEMTPTKNEINECPIKTQYVHILYLNLERASEAGYRLSQECCKLDTMSYISDKFGVAINGTYFDIHGSFFPIGPFKLKKDPFPRGKTTNATWRQNLPIPDAYKNDYGMVIVPPLESNNDPRIVRYSNAIPLVANIYGSDDSTGLFLAGPLLVENGVKVIDQAMLERTESFGIFEAQKYKCNIEKGNTSKVIINKPYNVYTQRPTGMGIGCVSTEKIPGTVMNCDQISPGELSHISNPNPRTMLLTRKNDDGKGSLALVYFEGRDSRGMGVNAEEMASFASSIGAIDAINLDGGRSSAISWRTEENPEQVFTANVTQKEFYPVGNILAVVKQ